MAELSLKEVEEIAMLARLALAPGEAETLRGELSAILGYVDQLASCDTTGVEPMTHAVPLDGPLREDRAAPGFSQEEALANAPRAVEDCFEVPRILTAEKQS